MSRDHEEPLLVRPEEAARLLSIGRSKMYAMLASGEIPCVVVGGSKRVSVAVLRRIAEGDTDAP